MCLFPDGASNPFFAAVRSRLLFILVIVCQSQPHIFHSRAIQFLPLRHFFCGETPGLFGHLAPCHGIWTFFITTTSCGFFCFTLSFPQNNRILINCSGVVHKPLVQSAHGKRVSSRQRTECKNAHEREGVNVMFDRICLIAYLWRIRHKKTARGMRAAA